MTSRRPRYEYAIVYDSGAEDSHLTRHYFNSWKGAAAYLKYLLDMGRPVVGVTKELITVDTN